MTADVATADQPGTERTETDMSRTDAMHETLRRTLEERGYQLWSQEYAHHYDLVVAGAGKVRVILWHESQGSRCDVSLFTYDAYGASEAGFAEVKVDPGGSKRAAFVLAVVDAAETELRGQEDGR